MGPDIILSVGYNNTQIAQATNAMLSQIQRATSAGGGSGSRALELSLGRISGKANEFQKSLDASTARVIAFGATAGILNNLSGAFKRMVESSIEVQNSLADINVLLNLSSKDLSKFSSDLFKVANSTSQSFSDATKAAQEFARQGLGMEQTLQRTKDALTLTRLSGISLEDSISSLTAATNSFSREALSTTDIINRLANVDAKFAVSSGDLADAIKRSGAAAADAGVEFNQLIALVTSAQQTTAQGGAKIGNAFKSVFTRLQRPKVLDDLESVGVATRDLNGKTVGTIQILKNLANSYGSLSSEQKSFVSETVGSVYQINTLKAALTDLGKEFSIYDGALQASANSTAAADVRNKSLNNTLASQLQRTANDLTQTFTNLSKLTIEPTIKGGVGFFDEIVKATGSGLDDSKTEGMGEQLAQGVTRGFAKGIGNVLAGPGLQLAVVALGKLFAKIGGYVVNSAKDLTGLNAKANERAVIEKTVNEYLLAQPGIIDQIKAGTISLAAVQAAILGDLQSQYALMSAISKIAPPLVSGIQSSGAHLAPNPLSSKIPHLSTGGLVSSAIQDALTRENRATGGNATLSQSNKLITPNNPFGFAAIDKRTQGSADEAISQHLMLGQSMAQVKKAGTSVPNLATDPGSMIPFTMMLAMGQLGSGMGGFGSIKTGLSSFKDALGVVIPQLFEASRAEKAAIDSQRKSIDAQKSWVDSFDKAKQRLITGQSKSERFQTNPNNPNDEQGFKKFSNAQDLESSLREPLQSLGATISEFDQKIARRTSQTRNFGIGLAVGGGIGGGILSSMTSNSSPDLSKAIDQITGGLEISGQALAAFPGKIGKGIAVFAILNSASSAVSEFVNGIEGSRRALEIQQSKTQKLSTDIQSVSASLSNLQNMVLDSSVSLEALNREQTNYATTVARIRTYQGGDELANKLETAPTSARKIEVLNEARENASKEYETQAAQFQIKELASKRKIFGTTAFSGGIFAGKTSEEKERAMDVIKSSAVGVFEKLSSGEKGTLVSLNKSGAYGESAFNRFLKNNKSSGPIVDSIRENNGLASDQKLFANEIRFLVNGEAISKNPKVAKVRGEGIEKNNRAQIGVDNAVRNEASLRRLFLNSGIIKGENVLEQGRFNDKNQINSRSLINEILKSKSSQVGLVAGEETVASYDTNNELQRIKNDTKDNLQDLNHQTASKLLDALSLKIDSIAKNSFGSQQSSQLNGDGIQTADAHNTNIIEGLNKGLGGAAKGGLTKFIGEDGSLDFERLNKSILSNSGATGKVQEDISNILKKDTGGLEVLKIIQDRNNQYIDISRSHLQEARIQTAKLEELKNELNFKDQIKFLGGGGILSDRGQRRKLERDVTRGSLLLQNGATPEIKGQGAELLLAALKDRGANLEIGGYDKNQNAFGINGNQQSQFTAFLLNTQAAGLRSVQGSVANRILGNTQGTIGGSFFSNYISDPRFKNTASIQVAAQHKVENASLIDKIDDNIDKSLDSMNKSFDLAGGTVFRFGAVLEGLKEKIIQETSNS